MTRWQLQQAKQQFSRLVELARSEGPQLVTRNGREVAVVIDVDDYRRMRSEQDFKRFLLSAPHLDELPIERSKEPARTIDL